MAGEFHVDRSRFVRPFYPGGDFEGYDYAPDAIVVDNPPFSILKRIIDFYQSKAIPFFLFAPHLTLLSRKNFAECAVICDAEVVYDNGARIKTDFLTNMDTAHAIRLEPGLSAEIRQANKKREYRTNAKYIYPDNVVTSALLGPCVDRGLNVRIPKEDAYRIDALDMQRAVGKKLFGGGFIVSDEWAAKIKAARPLQVADKETTVWRLSEREQKIARELGKHEKGQTDGTKEAEAKSPGKDV